MRVFRYTIEGSRHAREGWAVEIGPGDFRDTYWSSDRYQLGVKEVESLEFQFDTEDFEPIIGDYGSGIPPIWTEYASEDRARIPSQHGLRSTWYLRRGASPDLDTQIRAQREILEREESSLRSVQARRDSAQARLKELLAQRDERSASDERSGLQKRIDAGLAEPISDHERSQLQKIKQVYRERFGTAE